MPFCLGGGQSYFENHCGFGADNIVSARMVTAKGDLVDVSAISNPDLFWAIRGAGQLFGVVTSLTMQAYPVSVLGITNNSIWRSTVVYTKERASQVLEALEPIIKNTSAPARGMFFAVAPAPSYTTAISLSLMYFGPSAAAEQHFRVLLQDLLPTFVSSSIVLASDINNGSATLDAKGSLKRFASTGFQTFEPAAFTALIIRFEELQSIGDDFRSSAYALAWNTYKAANDPKWNAPYIAYSHHDINVWAVSIPSYGNPY